MRGFAATLFLLLALLVAGCVEPPASKGERYTFSGALTEDAGDGEIRELRATIEPYGGTLLLMESFPLQYQARDLFADSCEKVHKRFVARPYVASATECRAETFAENPEEPVVNEPVESHALRLAAFFVDAGFDLPFSLDFHSGFS